LEDGYDKRWQAMVNFGKWITTDESRVAGWYHSVMTIGPEPKPIQTGATLHTVCVTRGPLSTYKLFARVYGGKYNEDIDRHNINTVTKLKMVSLLFSDIFFLSPRSTVASHDSINFLHTGILLYTGFTFEVPDLQSYIYYYISARLYSIWYCASLQDR
jgi:hypothetical protein